MVDDCPDDVKNAWAQRHIQVNPNTDWQGVDADLRDAVVRTSMEMDATFYVSAGKEGGHSIEGRHAEGGAVDISRVNGTRFLLMNDATANSVGSAVAAGISNRLPADRIKMVFGPGVAFRFDRPMNPNQRRSLLAAHRSHVHITVWP